MHWSEINEEVKSGWQLGNQDVFASILLVWW